MKKLSILIIPFLIGSLSSCFIKDWLGIKSAPEGLAIYDDGWASMESDGARPDWVNIGWESSKVGGEKGYIFLSTGEGSTEDQAKLQSENFVRYNAGESLKLYAAQLLADASGQSEDSFNETTALIDALTITLVTAEEFWEKGYYVDPETGKELNDETGQDNPVYRYYTAIFISEDELDSMILSAWEKSKSGYDTAVIDAIEAELE